MYLLPDNNGSPQQVQHRLSTHIAEVRGSTIFIDFIYAHGKDFPIRVSLSLLEFILLWYCVLIRKTFYFGQLLNEDRGTG